MPLCCHWVIGTKLIILEIFFPANLLLKTLMLSDDWKELKAQRPLREMTHWRPPREITCWSWLLISWLLRVETSLHTVSLSQTYSQFLVKPLVITWAGLVHARCRWVKLSVLLYTRQKYVISDVFPSQSLTLLLKKLNLTQQKLTCNKLKPGFIALYDVQPGNGSDMLLQRHCHCWSTHTWHWTSIEKPSVLYCTFSVSLLTVRNDSLHVMISLYQSPYVSFSEPAEAMESRESSQWNASQEL